MMHRTAFVSTYKVGKQLVIVERLGLVAGALLVVYENRQNDTWLEDLEPTRI